MAKFMSADEMKDLNIYLDKDFHRNLSRRLNEKIDKIFDNYIKVNGFAAASIVLSEALYPRR